MQWKVILAVDFAAKRWLPAITLHCGRNACGLHCRLSYLSVGESR